MQYGITRDRLEDTFEFSDLVHFYAVYLLDNNFKTNKRLEQEMRAALGFS